MADQHWFNTKPSAHLPENLGGERVARRAPVNRVVPATVAVAVISLCGIVAIIGATIAIIQELLNR